MRLKIVSAFICCSLILSAQTSPNFNNEKLSISSLAPQQEKFESSLFEGIVAALVNLDLSQSEVFSLKKKFNSHIALIYGSIEQAEKLLEEKPDNFDEKYLQLFAAIKKDLLQSRKDIF